MSAHPLDQAWLTAWRHELNNALGPLLATFESTCGRRLATTRSSRLMAR